MTPSPETWKRLEGQLETNNTSSSTGKIWWAIAASLITLLVVGSLLFTNDNVEAGPVVETTPTQIQETQSFEPTIELATQSEEEELLETEAVSGSDKQPQEQINRVIKTQSSPVVAQNESSGDEGKQDNAVLKQALESPIEAVVATVEEPKDNMTQKLIQQPPSFEQRKVDEVVAKVLALQDENQEVSAEAIDALLASAQRDIANRRLLEQSTVRIDPSALLQEVETEMERSFRDKVFEALGEGFVKVRTAVAERNN